MATEKDKITASGTDGRPDTAQIAEWKKKHGDIHKITVKRAGDSANENPIISIVRQPKLADLKHGTSVTNKKGEGISGTETVYTNCQLYADPEVSNDDKVRMAVLAKFQELSEVADAEMEKL